MALRPSHVHSKGRLGESVFERDARERARVRERQGRKSVRERGEGESVCEREASEREFVRERQGRASVWERSEAERGARERRHSWATAS